MFKKVILFALLFAFFAIFSALFAHLHFSDSSSDQL